MIVAISGYNGSGKSTLVRHLAGRLADANIRYGVMRFDALYPSSLVSRTRKSSMQRGSDGGISLRAAAAQTGGWNRRFRWYHFVNVVGAALAVLVIRIRYWKSVVIFDRFFFDRFVHFETSSWLCRAAMKFIPRPTIGFILMPEFEVLEERLIKRCDKFDAGRLSISESDRLELQRLRDRYCQFQCNGPDIHLVDSSADHGKQFAEHLLFEQLRRCGVTPESRNLAEHGGPVGAESTHEQ